MTFNRILVTFGLIVVLTLGIGCGTTKTTNAPQPAAAAQPDLAVADITAPLKRSMLAVDDFLGAYRDCMDTKGCAHNESKSTLELIDTALRATGPFVNAQPTECAGAFRLLRDGLASQFRTVNALPGRAGDVEKAGFGVGAITDATDVIGRSIDGIAEDCP